MDNALHDFTHHFASFSVKQTQRKQNGELLAIAASRTYIRLGVCGIPQYGSESEFQKPNRITPNYLSNSEKVGITTFSEFRNLLYETDY